MNYGYKGFECNAKIGAYTKDEQLQKRKLNVFWYH